MNSKFLRIAILAVALLIMVVIVSFYFMKVGTEEADRSMEGFSCAAGKAGWQRATAVSPDAVSPCGVGRVGSCSDNDYEYVRGTAWCRPR